MAGPGARFGAIVKAGTPAAEEAAAEVAGFGSEVFAPGATLAELAGSDGFVPAVFSELAAGGEEGALAIATVGLEAEPILDGILLAIMVVAGVVVLLGLIHAVRTVVAVVGGLIGKAIGFLPYVGGFVESGVEGAAHWVVGELGNAEAALDGLMSAFWHDLAKLAQWVWREITGGAASQHTITQIIHATANGQAATRGQPHVSGRLKVLAAQVAELHRELVAIPGTLAAGISPRIAARLRPIELQLGKAIPAELAALDHRAVELQRQLDVEKARTSRLEELLTAGAGAGIVAGALTALGSSWIRCRNWRNLGKAVCGLPGHLVDDLLGLLLDYFVLVNICQVIPWLEVAFAEVAGPLIGTLAAAGAGLCNPSHRPPAPLEPPRLHLPAVSGFALHLPA